MTARAPLRVTIPAIVFLLGVFLAAFSLAWELSASVKRSEEAAREGARTVGTLIADGVESAFHYGDEAEARSRLSHATADRTVTTAVLFDEKDRVLFATRFQLEGVAAAATPFGEWAQAFPAIRATLQGRIERNARGDRLTTLYPVLLSVGPGGGVATRVGLLAIEHDLGPEIAAARHGALIRSLAFAVCLSLACLLTWVVIHRVVTRRVVSLVSATRAVAIGEEPPAPLTGGDELAELSAAFSQMARTVRADRDELKRREQTFRELIENGSDIIMSLDGEGRIAFASPSLTRLLGYPLDEVLGRPLVELCHPEDAPRLVTTLLDAGRGTRPEGTWDLQLRFRHFNGALRQIEAIGRPVREEAGASHVVSARDVTERAELEERLRQAQKMEAIGRLAGGVAHDFNNLLTAILGFGDVLREKLRTSHPGALSDVDEIVRAGERAASLTKQLLAFSRKQ
ncbi:MAG TPA: PAS domain S-box protein, partial [Thermoanaerobaculia bacterium]|nr:PAS domain S-box protein [Thermoanaerobaculia bacterium]